MGARWVATFYGIMSLYFLWMYLSVRAVMDARAVIVPVSDQPGVTAARITAAAVAASQPGAPRRLMLVGRHAYQWVQAAVYSTFRCEISHRTINVPEHVLPLHVALLAAPTDVIVTSSTPCVRACQRRCCDCAVYTNASLAPPAHVQRTEERLCRLYGCPCP